MDALSVSSNWDTLSKTTHKNTQISIHNMDKLKHKIRPGSLAANLFLSTTSI